MKPLFTMTVVSQQISFSTAGKVTINARAESLNIETNKIAFDVDIADAVLFPVGTQITATVEALEA